MTTQELDREAEPIDLTPLVQAARRGFRRDVAALLEALPFGVLYLPLAESVEGAAPDGIALEVGLRFQPHLLPVDEGQTVTVLCSSPELIKNAAEQFDWRTGEEELEFVSLPAHLALEMALDVIDEKNVVGLLLNPTAGAELFLTRQELASLVAGKALPLVGYVEDLPPQDFEEAREIEGAEPLPAAVTEALDACIARVPGLLGWRAAQTFNPERDLEPHLTLHLTVDAPDRKRVADAVFEAISDRLPPPGYVDVLFAEVDS